MCVKDDEKFSVLSRNSRLPENSARNEREVCGSETVNSFMREEP